MIHIGSMTEQIKAFAERMKVLCDDPEYQRNLERLRAENAASEAQARESERMLRLRASGVPFGLWEALRSPKPTDALGAVETFLAAPRSCTFLVLSGPRGRGKTYACASAAERKGRYILAQELVTAGMFDPVWHDLTGESLIAIDELGAEYPNDAFRASLYALLDKRYAHQRKTIIGTNLNAADFRQRYCPGAEDRLLERLTKGGMWVNLPGESMRPHWTESEREDA